jgi:nucleotide-binding universal stress UspA family protein
MRPHPSSGAGNTAPGSDPVFDRIIVGIDSTDESLVAAAQVGVLRGPGSQLVLVAAVEKHLASHAGLFAAHAQDTLAAGTSTELERARELVGAADALLASGSLVQLLCSECERRGGTLIAVGVRPHRRLAALTFGGHDVEALHDVRCSVLIARPGWGPAHPTRVVVGVDGSPESQAAEGVARSLAARLACEVLPVVALESDVDLAVLRAEREDALLHPGSLRDGVVSASTPRGLVVVGRARERGRRWGGGLAERVVYGARCSVLVVEAGNADEPSAVPESPSETDG